MSGISFPASVDSLPQVLSHIESFLEACRCPPKAALSIATAAEEIFVNIANYSGAPVVLLDIDCEGGVVSICFTDEGTPFDPLGHVDPDTTLDANERQIGGLGILMVKKMMDTISYERKDGTNILRMEKRFN